MSDDTKEIKKMVKNLKKIETKETRELGIIAKKYLELKNRKKK